MNEETILPPEPVTNEAIALRLCEAAREQIRTGKIHKKNLVWLELTGCSGNIISLMNGTNPDLEYAITSMFNLVYSNSLMAAEGEQAIQRLMDTLEGEFILAVEGAVALRNNGLYNVIGRWKEEPFTALQAAQLLGENV